jgi:two-component system, NarL family, sensor histidine kinase DegS
VINAKNIVKRTPMSKLSYESIFEQSGIAIYIIGRDGKFIQVNRSVAGLLDYSLEQLLKMNISEICVSSTNWEKLQEIADKEYFARNDHFILRKKDGTEIITIITASVLIDENQDVLGYHGIILDSTVSEKEVAALKHSEERFRQLSDAAFEGIMFHENFIILDCNQAYAKLYGYKRHEMIGKSLMELVPQRYHDHLRNKITSKYQGFDYIPNIKKDGTEFMIEANIRVINYQGKDINVTVSRDVTERLRMENELRGSEEKLRIMFESIVEGVIVYDLHGQISQANDAIAQLYGFQNKEELIGRNALNLIAEQDHTRANYNVKMRAQNFIKHSAEYICVRKDGTEFNAEWSISVMKNKDGNPVGMVAVIRDITERKKEELNMQFYLSEITKAHEEERRRLACELHDETIQSLIALTYDIEAINKAKNNLSHGTVEQLESLQNKAIEIVNDVRRFSHELRPSVLDKLGLVAALDLLVKEIKVKKINAHFERTGVIRRFSSDMEIALFRITQEALRNVWKHSQATDCFVAIHFAPHEIKLKITDNGQGFDLPEDQNELASKGKLGLIGMRERTTLVGGQFSLISHHEKGTTIIIEMKA